MKRILSTIIASMLVISMFSMLAPGSSYGLSSIVLRLEAYEQDLSSSPFVMPWNGTHYVVDNDLYPEEGEHKGSDATDYYMLEQPMVPKDGEYSLLLQEVFDGEIDHHDTVRLITVDHSPDVDVGIDEHGVISTFRTSFAPISAVDNYENDILLEIAALDEIGVNLYHNDSIIVDFGTLDTSQGAKLLLSYDGYGAPRRFEPFVKYFMEVTIHIQTKNSTGHWVTRHKAIPRDTEYLGVYPLSGYLPDPLGELKVRLLTTMFKSTAGHFVNYVAFDNTANEPVTSDTLTPTSAVHSSLSDVLSAIVDPDDIRVDCQNGENITVTFPYNPTSEERNFIIFAEGWYDRDPAFSGSYGIEIWNPSSSSWQNIPLPSGWGNFGPYANDKTKDLDITSYVPSDATEVRVRINQWLPERMLAAVDYVALMQNGFEINPTEATDESPNNQNLLPWPPSRPKSVLNEVLHSDDVKCNWWVTVRSWPYAHGIGKRRLVLTFPPIPPTPEKLREILAIQRDLLVNRIRRYGKKFAEIHTLAYLNLNDSQISQIVNWFGNLSGLEEVHPEIKEANEYMELMITTDEAEMYYEFLKEMYSKVSPLMSKSEICESFEQYINGTASGQQHFIWFDSEFGIAELIERVTENYNQVILEIPDELPPEFPYSKAYKFFSDQISAIERSETEMAHINYIDFGTNETGFITAGSLDEILKGIELLSEGAHVSTASTISLTGEHSPDFGISIAMVTTITLIAGSTMILGAISVPPPSAPVPTSPTTPITTSTSVDINPVQPLVSPPPEPPQPPVPIDIKFDIMETAKSCIGVLTYITMMNKMQELVIHSFIDKAKSEAIKNGRIISVTTPDIVVQNGDTGTETGTITIENNTPLPIGAMPWEYVIVPKIWIDIIGPIVDGKRPIISTTFPKEEVVLWPGETESVEFEYTVPLPQVFGQCFQYEVVAHAQFSWFNDDYATSVFYACNQEAQEAIESIEASTILSGEVGPGESETAEFIVGDDAEQISLSLSYLGSDLDLHLYSIGRRRRRTKHVGLNYLTGEVELEIPNSAYSGPASLMESISVRGDVAGSRFEVEVVGVDVIGEEEFSVTLSETPSLPALLDLSPSIMRTEIFQGQERQFSIVASEYGGYDSLHNVLLAATNLFDGKGNSIPSTNISFDLNNFDVVAGSSVFVVMNVLVSESTPAGIYIGELSATDENGKCDESEVVVEVRDNTPPSITIVTPSEDILQALQDGVTLDATVSDPSGVDWVTFSIREPGGTRIDPMFESMAAIQAVDDEWQLPFDTIQLPDGYYLLLVNVSDMVGNEGYKTADFSIRNWACIELLPASESNKAGRTMPVKFSLRVVEAVDPAQPFVWNEELTIVIYEEGHPDNILQESTYGDSARDYRIDSISELYITNFRTLKRPITYVVEIYRKGMLIGSFTFETVK